MLPALQFQACCFGTEHCVCLIFCCVVLCRNHEQGYNARKGSFAALTDPSGATEPYRPSWGNYGPDSRGECGVVAARRFHMPDYKGRGDNAPFWYGFDYGSVYFTTISTEHSLVPGSRQYKWLEAELAAVDRWVWVCVATGLWTCCCVCVQ